MLWYIANATIKYQRRLKEKAGNIKMNDNPWINFHLHKWIASYNLRLVVLTRFYRWLYYPNIEDPKRRSELSELSPEMTIETDLENKWNNH